MMTQQPTRRGAAGAGNTLTGHEVPVARRVGRPGPVLLLCAAFLVSALAGCATTQTADTETENIKAAAAAPAAARRGAEEALGIEVKGVRLSSAGYMLDFRYRLVDPAKAAPLFDRKRRPVLLDEGSGAAVGVPDTPKLGQLRTSGRSKLVPGREYFVMFANPGKLVQPGAKVSILVGDMKIAGLTVE